MIRNGHILILLLAAGCSSPDEAPSSTPVRGESSLVRMELSRLDFGKLARKEVQVTEKGGKTSVYGGVLLSDVVSLMGIPMGVHPKGRPPIEYVVVEGADRYRALFSKAELDPAFAESHVILANRLDGQELASADGPWRLVVPADRIRSRWVKQARVIEVSSVR